MRLVTSFFVPLTSILRLAAVRKERVERNGLLKERFEWFAAFCYSHWCSRPNDLIVEAKRSCSRWFVIIRHVNHVLRYYLRREQRPGHFGHDSFSCSSRQESFSVMDNLFCYLESRKDSKNYKLESLNDSWGWVNKTCDRLHEYSSLMIFLPFLFITYDSMWLMMR